jgi:hypothetical protein
MPTATRTALIVSDDAGLKEEIGSWLEASGDQVLSCPGPRHPDDSCVGLRTNSCPLARAADVAIVDLHPSGDTLVDATARIELTSFYRRQGSAVIALVDGGNWVHQSGLTGVAILNRFVARSELLDTITELPPMSTRGD